MRALQRVSGPFKLLPDVPIITSLDVIITDRTLGIGGYGQVYAGYWNEQLVAVKVLDKTVPEQVRFVLFALNPQISMCIRWSSRR